MIVACFTLHSLPQVALKKLQGMTQEGRLINEFITDFLNLKLEAQISDSFAEHVLIQNMGYALLEKTILKYGEPKSFGSLVTQIQKVGRNVEYLQTVCPIVEHGITAKNEFQDV